MTAFSIRANAILLASKNAYKNGLPQVRNSSGSYFQANNFDNFRQSYNAGLKSADKSRNLWKKIMIFGALPSIALCMWIAWSDHKREHAKPRKEYIPYPYLNVRNKPFPWGDGNHCFFHNPEKNYVPGVGFEKDPEHH